MSSSRKRPEERDQLKRGKAADSETMMAAAPGRGDFEIEWRVLLGLLGTRVRVEELDREALCAGHRGHRARAEDMGPLFPGSDTGYASRVTPRRVAPRALNRVVSRENSPEVTEVTEVAFSERSESTCSSWGKHFDIILIA